MKTILSVLIPFCMFSLDCLADDPVLEIGSRRELFVDRFLIDELEHAELKLHPPQLMPAVTPPRPHGHYATVLKSDRGYQFYYRGDTQPGNHWKKGWEQYHDGEVTLYAESPDAIHWTLPHLGIYPDHPTFPQGNVVLMNEFLVNHNFTPFIDTRPGVPESENTKHWEDSPISPISIWKSNNAAGRGGSKHLFLPMESTGNRSSRNQSFRKSGENTLIHRTMHSGLKVNGLTSVISVVLSKAIVALPAPPHRTSFTGHRS
ncbi:hypothetical protein [Gimesia maris]|uniref:hypothetical protein n=1 Tax=Gimesia maris TaxID=122 RepID=UPI0012D462FE|nr:hypothetical protein [Gimesia maris]QGQ28115.1 hypothetical protein F1729_05265 [Gimesia maris]